MRANPSEPIHPIGGHNMDLDILIIFAISGFASWKTFTALWMKYPDAEIWLLFVSLVVLVGGGSILALVWGCVSGANPTC
jgi:hypothetical protein